MVSVLQWPGRLLLGVSEQGPQCLGKGQMSRITGRLWDGSSDSAGVTNHKVTAIAKESSSAGGEPAILHSRGRVDSWEGSVVFHGATVPPSMDSWMGGAGSGSCCIGFRSRTGDRGVSRRGKKPTPPWMGQDGIEHLWLGQRAFGASNQGTEEISSIGGCPSPLNSAPLTLHPREGALKSVSENTQLPTA